MFDNKKAQYEGWGLAKGFLLVLLTFFAVGFIFVVLYNVLNTNLIPFAVDYVNAASLNDTTKQETVAHIDKYYAAWKSVPIIMFFLIVLWFVIRAFRPPENQVIAQ
jgi:hypothetical protein